jgi:hypothetical protein
MELRQVEPLFVLLTLLALVACASRLVPSAAQSTAHAPAQTATPGPMPIRFHTNASRSKVSPARLPPSTFVLPAEIGPLAPQAHMPVESLTCSSTGPQIALANGVHLTLSLAPLTWRERG